MPLDDTQTHPAPRLSAGDSLALAREYKATGDVKVRNRLVMTFAPLVKYIVYKKVSQLPPHCEVEELISSGLEALVGAIDRFDPERGVPVQQYVWTRIHGAVLDDLRRRDWAPRSLRQWERDMVAAKREFRTGHGHMPTSTELASMLGISTQALSDKLHEIAMSDVTSLNSLVQGDDEMLVERIDTLADPDVRNDPAHAAELQDRKARIRATFEMLPRREREIVVMLYVQNLKLREIGEVLGISESRVCQIHRQVKHRLRGALSEDQMLELAA